MIKKSFKSIVQYQASFVDITEFQYNLIVLIEAVGVYFIPLYVTNFPPAVIRT